MSVLATLVTTFVIYPHHRYHASLNGVVYLVAATLPALAMIATAQRSPDARRPWLLMSAGVVFNSLGDVVNTLYDQHQHPVPNPGLSDVFYLVSYASFLAAVVLLTRGPARSARMSLRLDGLIAAVSVAALVSFAWLTPLAARGGVLRVVVDMAYPMADLVALVLLATSLASPRYRPGWSSGLLMSAFGWFFVGDALHVNNLATNHARAVSFTDITFVMGIWMMGLAASAHDRRATARRLAPDEASVSVAAVPVVSGAIALGVLAASWASHRPPEVGALALGALALVMVRMWLALREERRLMLASAHDARTDALTGLGNRRRLFEQIDELLSDPAHPSVGVILIDLDGFKEVNDEIGHAAGDELLCIVAQRFTRRLADRGSLTRLGGDEFAVVRAASQSDLVALADEFLESTAEDYSLQGHRVRLSASMGVALADDAGDDPYELLRRADVAMYQAKRERSGVSVFAATVTSRDVSHPHLPATSNARHGAPVTSNARNGASAS